MEVKVFREGFREDTVLLRTRRILLRRAGEREHWATSDACGGSSWERLAWAGDHG